jgi:electron transport complex protein RnfG
MGSERRWPVRASILRKAAPIAFITVVVLISVTLLAFTESFTREQLAAQEHQQVIEKLEAMFPDMSDYDFIDDLYILYASQTKIGYAFIATGSGYGGDISILVALDDTETVKGIIILSQQETPGIGARITGNEFTGQFGGLDINDINLMQNGGQIDGLTGATISSTAVVNAVRDTALEKIKQIEGLN